jgi:aspartate kinase
VREELARGCVVIVAGFQGVSRTREVTTLGRGGSDTTAVALAAALGADRCDIFTDVDGVFIPQIRDSVRGARILREPSTTRTMVELAVGGGSGHASEGGGDRCAVQRAHQRRVRVQRMAERRYAHYSEERTWKGSCSTGLASADGQTKLTIRALPPTMESMSTIMSALAAERISVDMMTPADRQDGRRQLQMTIHEADLDRALELCTLPCALGGEASMCRPG